MDDILLLDPGSAQGLAHGHLSVAASPHVAVLSSHPPGAIL